MKAVLIILAAGAFLAAGAAQASMVEQLLAPLCPSTPLGPCVYQGDFGAPGDAPGEQAGVCGPSDRAMPFNQPRNGLLVPIDDEADNVFLNVLPSQVGRIVTVTLEASPVAGLLDLAALRVFSPGCAAEVPGGGGTVVRFQAQVPGPYIVQAGLRKLLAVDLDGQGEPGTDACYPFCPGALNAAAGYGLFASG